MKLPFHRIEQLVARVARGRRGRPNAPELALASLGLDPFGSAERSLNRYLADPDVAEADKARAQAFLPL